MSTKQEKLDLAREAAENDLLTFIRLVAPQRMLGQVHQDLIEWWTRSEAHTNQLVLLPRGHQKSILAAYRAAWEITRNPAITVLYISSTSNLAEKQLKVIQDILTSRIYRRYWPTMVKEREGMREKWTTSEISVDHPLRREEGIRDSTVFTAGLTTNITGLHCDIAILDDVVTKENADTDEGRNRVKSQYSLLSSIENPNAKEWVVGTRYHARDLYGSIQEMEEVLYDKEGNEVGSTPIYEIFERKVEDQGDGTGEFLWPRQRRYDGKWFGFDTPTLARIRGKYLDKAQYYAQYYNDPNDPTGSRIGQDLFQYYDKSHLEMFEGDWYFKGDKLNVYAAIDFAFSLKKRADFTAIVVIGINAAGHIYILDIDRFKTDSISEYFKHILASNVKWSFRKMRAETTVAQVAIVKELKSRIREEGLVLSIDEYRPTRSEGDKATRIRTALEPRYENLAMWHYRGGNCTYLEEELTMSHPPHDDVSDALASVTAIAMPPRRAAARKQSRNNIITHARFGGVQA